MLEIYQIQLCRVAQLKKWALGSLTKVDKIAQGREKVKTLLETDEKLMKSVLSDVKDYLELN